MNRWAGLIGLVSALGCGTSFTAASSATGGGGSGGEKATTSSVGGAGSKTGATTTVSTTSSTTGAASTTSSTTASTTSATTTSSSGGGGGCVKIGGDVECHPITLDKCAPGASCDWYYADQTVGAGFKCYNSGNTTPECLVAKPQNGIYCVAKTTYHPKTNQCRRYCCSNADCVGGVCTEKGIFKAAPELGLCTCL